MKTLPSKQTVWQLSIKVVRYIKESAGLGFETIACISVTSYTASRHIICEIVTKLSLILTLLEENTSGKISYFYLIDMYFLRGKYHKHQIWSFPRKKLQITKFVDILGPATTQLDILCQWFLIYVIFF